MMTALFVFCAICLLLGILVACTSSLVNEIRRVRRLEVWPSVMALIVESRLHDSDSETKAVCIHVEYQYELFGAAYSGSEDIWGRPEERAGNLSWLYDLGKPLRIVYDPDQPSQSLIADDRHAELDLGSILMDGLGIGLAAFAIGSALWAALADASP